MLMLNIILVKVVEFQPMRSKHCELTAPETNSQSWLNVPIQEIKNQKKCHETILERVKFEIVHFKILRLDDHIDAMITSMAIIDYADAVASNKKLLLEEISHLDLAHVKLTQLTFRHPESVKFCLAKKLNTILDLNKNDFSKALLYHIDFVAIHIDLFHLKKIQVLQKVDTEDFVTKLGENFRKKIAPQVFSSLSKLESLLSNIDLLPFESQKTLCMFIRDQREFLQYEQAFCLIDLPDSAGIIDRCIEKAESQLAKISAFDQENRLNVDEVDKFDMDALSDRKDKKM